MGEVMKCIGMHNMLRIGLSILKAITAIKKGPYAARAIAGKRALIAKT